MSTDNVGMAASEPLSDALRDMEQAMPRFSRWLYRTIRKDLGEHVLDAGAGIGTYSEFLLGDGRRVEVLEPDAVFAARLRERFARNSAVTVHEMDLAAPGGLTGLPAVDSAICLNVLEHIEDDRQASSNICGAVRPGGTLVAMVPAYPRLFNPMDRALGHYRRYSRSQFLGMLTSAGWSIERCYRFNAFAIAGWFLSGCVLKRKKPGSDLERLYDAVIPVLSAIERHVVRGMAGLSLIAVCRRRS